MRHNENNVDWTLNLISDVNFQYQREKQSETESMICSMRNREKFIENQFDPHRLCETTFN